MKRIIAAFIACSMLAAPAFAQTPGEDHHESTMQQNEDHADAQKMQHKAHRKHGSHHHKRHRRTHPAGQQQ